MKRNTIAQLITVIEDILAAMDQRYQVGIILLDFSKAFDTVPHQRLLHGIRSNTLKWLNTWLTQRWLLMVSNQNLLLFSLVFLRGQF